MTTFNNRHVEGLMFCFNFFHVVIILMIAVYCPVLMVSKIATWKGLVHFVPTEDSVTKSNVRRAQDA